MDLDGMRAYKNSFLDDEAQKNYEEGWDRIFGSKEDKKEEDLKQETTG